MRIAKQYYPSNPGYTRFQLLQHDISYTCKNICLFLPYIRRYANLSGSNLTELIKTAYYGNWQAVDLDSCGLDSFPVEVCDLCELNMLYLGNIQYKWKRDYEENGKGPDWMSTIRCGEQNTINVLPAEIEGLINLQVLSLDGLNLAQFYTTAKSMRPFNLGRLKYLDIVNCGLPQLPNAFLVPTIEQLYYNCLEDRLADSFFSMHKLRVIYLTGSAIATLPDMFDCLPEIEVLDLSYTKLAELPPSLKSAKNLQVLNIEKTPLEESLGNQIGRWQIPDMRKWSAQRKLDLIYEKARQI